MSCSLRSSLAGWHRCRSETPSSSPLPRRLSPRCRATKDYWRTQMVDSVMADDDKVAPIYKHEDIYELLCAPASSRRSPTSSTRASMGRSPRQAEKVGRPGDSYITLVIKIVASPIFLVMLYPDVRHDRKYSLMCPESELVLMHKLPCLMSQCRVCS
jgi:hypothetical protein